MAYNATEETGNSKIDQLKEIGSEQGYLSPEDIINVTPNPEEMINELETMLDSDDIEIRNKASETPKPKEEE